MGCLQKYAAFVSLILLFIPNVSLADILLVTRTVGTVTLKDRAGVKPVARTAFPLLKDQTLQIGDKSIAVILHAGKAQQIVGPANVTTKNYQNTLLAGNKTSALQKLLSKKSSISNVGATRNHSTFQLQRPITGGTLMELRQIKWSCENCGELKVEVVDLESFASIWSKTATNKIMYDGPTLKPGEYAIKIREKYLSFRVADVNEKKLVQEAITIALKNVQSLSATDQISIKVALLAHANMQTEVLYLLDKMSAAEPNNKELHALRKDYQNLSFKK